MQRRHFITLIGGAAAAWPLAAASQHTDQMRRIGVLVAYAEGDPEMQARLMAFRQGLEQLGWSEGRNIRFDIRFAPAGAGQEHSRAQKLVALKPDVIFAHTPQVVASLQRESRAIPVVFVGVADPLGAGFVASLSRPGGNLTGFLGIEASIVGKWLTMLKEIAPITRVALIANPNNIFDLLCAGSGAGSSVTFNRVGAQPSWERRGDRARHRVVRVGQAKWRLGVAAGCNDQR
jgi:putative tryptophan/tyrosine transport system substrate-binding protein